MAEALRRNTKITPITRISVISIVVWISEKDSRIFFDLSWRMRRFTEGGSCAKSCGKAARIASLTWMVLAPGCR